MDSGQEQNYWPGFVDALANVVLTLIFVLVVFVFALVMASNKVEKKMQEVTAMENPAKVEIEVLQQKLQETQAELDRIKKFNASNAIKTEDITVEETAPSVREGEVDISTENKNKITLIFPQSVTAMDQKTQEKFNQSLELIQPGNQNKKILIRSVMGKESYSVAQRLAYYRALIIRNFLISQRGIDTGRISSSIIPPSANSGDSRVEIVFVEE